MIVEPVNVQNKSSPPSVQASRSQLDIQVERQLEINQQKEDQFDVSKLNEKVAELQRNLNMIHDVNLKFSVHKATGKLMIIVSDEDTGKVIREIPPSQMLDIAAKLDEMMGIIFDQRG